MAEAAAPAPISPERQAQHRKLATEMVPAREDTTTLSARDVELHKRATESLTQGKWEATLQALSETDPHQDKISRTRSSVEQYGSRDEKTGLKNRTPEERSRYDRSVQATNRVD